MMYGQLVRAKRTYVVLFFGAVLLLGALFLLYQKVNGSEAGSTSADTSEKAALRARLSTMQYYVTQEDGTEPAYKNEYWDSHEEGIYVDVVSGEALFSSTDKYDSQTGWPSFTKPIKEGVTTMRTDYKLGLPRTEIRSTKADSHLGHIFDDGPADRGGKRYCINSAALRFVPKADMEKEGYGAHLSLF